ncbi:glycosyltransferase [Roseofilum capinflatum]|uniref:Glycosyltransferase n=1 Tax=Roseofilum capinflatum BLCC-M114 TaxID=3022440 RepID=A0ABT7B0H3_9CYAN|nr:glycosyltransferase [Roseofilum capinflatum]MDJ1172644.1 glycosyltransferase [Roseofilum capinflatum BLCC-M114]
MTSLIYSHFIPERQLNLQSPLTLACDRVSVVIPVKDNQPGIDRFLFYFFDSHSPENYPCEILIIDNNSSIPLVIKEEFRHFSLPIKLFQCPAIGPASARNLGIQQAQGEWILFTDSDCIPTASFLTGYQTMLNGAVGYAGNVKPLHHDRLSAYYNSQEILIPPSVQDQLGDLRPHYLITANTLIWKPALAEIGGFDGQIQIAAGEDIDLGFRLSEVGQLSYALPSVVYHDFGQGLSAFVRRFKRYGKGNRLVGVKHEVDLKPRRFAPVEKNGFNWFLSTLQYGALMWGYWD